jgi:hypothetical protein
MYLLVAALVIAGWMVVLISSRRTLNRTRAELRLEFQRQFDSLSAKLHALERNANEQADSAAISAGAGSRDGMQAKTPDEITPETLVAISETVTALLGKKVHIRSVKILPAPSAGVNPWAQHGRAVVQASHDFSQRSRP